MVYLVTGATNNGWEHCTGCVIAGEPSLHQAGAVIAHQSGSLFVVAHGVSSETRVRAHARKATVSSWNEIPRLLILAA